LEAAVEGAKVRFRPILMTSFAFIAGLIPLVLATGAGAIGNRTIGSASLGGMLIGTLFGVLIIPGLYYTLAKLVEGKDLLQGESHTPISESFGKEPSKASLLKKILKLNVLLKMREP
jgi:HAE1 family hydrophobic/amphiphilic exporter-1